MGADGMTELFESQLFTFKNTLVKLYKQKTKAIAEREVMRFKYLSGLKAKFLNIVSDMYSEIYMEKNLSGENVIRYVIEYIQGKIPMATLSGGTQNGWGGLPYNIGGRLTINFFSPSTHILSEPFDGPSSPDQRPAYLKYPNHYGKNSSATVDYMVKNYSLFGNYTRMSEQYLPNTSTYGYIDFSFPPSFNWVQSYLRGHKSPGYVLTQDAYDYMVEKFTKTYPSGNLVNVIDEFAQLYENIILQTHLIVNLQNDIDLAEKNLAEFVDAYKEHIGTTQTLDEILAALQEEAARADVQPASDIPVGASVHAEMADEIIPPPLPPEEKSMKVPLMAAAAIGIFMLLNKGK